MATRLEHLGLAGGELGDGPVAPGRGPVPARARCQPAELAEHQAGQPGREDRLTAGRGAHGVDDLRAADADFTRYPVAPALIASSTSCCSPLAERMSTRVGQVADGAAHLVAAQAGQVEVEHEHVGAGGPGPAHGRRPVAGRGHHGQAVAWRGRARAPRATAGGRRRRARSGPASGGRPGRAVGRGQVGHRGSWLGRGGVRPVGRGAAVRGTVIRTTQPPPGRVAR